MSSDVKQVPYIVVQCDWESPVDEARVVSVAEEPPVRAAILQKFQIQPRPKPSPTFWVNSYVFGHESLSSFGDVRVLGANRDEKTSSVEIRVEDPSLFKVQVVNDRVLFAECTKTNARTIVVAPKMNGSWTHLHPKGPIFSVDVGSDGVYGVSGGVNGSVRY